MTTVPAEVDLVAANELMALTTGLWASQTLVAAVDLDMFTFLADRGGADIAAVASGLGIDQRPADILLTACAALGLLECAGGVFTNAAVATRYLVRGDSDYFGDYVRMLRDYVNPGWMRVTEAVRTNHPSRETPKPQQNLFDADNRPVLFWEGLATLSRITARALATSVDFGQTSTLLDVGGGGAEFSMQLCRQNPGLSAIVFDLPHVCSFAERRINAAGLSGRVTVQPGDFFADAELPHGADAILLSMILHDWDVPQNHDLLEKCFRALPSGGLLVISELLVDSDRTGPLDAALMGMNMLVGTYGRNYTEREYHDWLRDTGFTGVRTVRFRAPAANGAILASKP
ncbi:MAG TPA: methyltransferase [Candidatus Limnocylindrales bacterium]|nr:methyltransferase [Candidatus Limnocylindrales bacterium]